MPLNNVQPTTVSTAVRGAGDKWWSHFFLTSTTDAVTPLWLCRTVLLNGLSKVCSCPLKPKQISFGVGESTVWEVTWDIYSLIGLLFQWLMEYLTPCGSVSVLRIDTKKEHNTWLCSWEPSNVNWLRYRALCCIWVGIMKETEGCFQRIISAAVHLVQQEAFWRNQDCNNCLNMLLCWEDDNGESRTLVEQFLLCCAICHTHFPCLYLTI